MSQKSIVKAIENAVDSDKEISIREFLSRVYIRPRLFWICVLVPPLLAMMLTALIPAEYKATAKILIRYSSSESAFLRDLIPENRPMLSGASSAEILKGIPTLVATIKTHDIRDDDIAKKPHEVLGGYVSGALEDFFPSDLPPGLPGVDPKTLLLAKAFKDSLEDQSVFSLSSSKSKPVEVLEKSSQTPSSMKGDELITITVPSFNRLKVAEMTNGLAQAFIEEYYRLSAEDAHRSYEFLAKLVEQAEADLKHAEQNAGDVSSSALAVSPVTSGKEEIYRQSPLLESMQTEMANLEANLARLRQIYSESSPAVVKAKNNLESLRFGVVRQERLEVGRQILGDLKAKRYQAQNTERVYLERIVPISIVEPAFTPKKSISKLAARYLLSGGVGLVLGLVLGLGVVVVLSVTDPRLYTSWDIERATDIPIFGWISDISQPRFTGGKSIPSSSQGGAFPDSPQVENGLLQILSRLDASDFYTSGSTLVVASPSVGEGRSFVSLRLAKALARSGKHSVLLIDANVRNNSLTRFFDAQGKAGFIESLTEVEPFATHVIKTNVDGLSLLPSGDTAKRGDLGFYRRGLKELLAGIAQQHDFVILDTPAILDGNEGLVCSMAADQVLLVVEASVTRKPLLKAACQRLAEVGVVPQGIILNKKKELLPAYIYRRV